MKYFLLCPVVLFLSLYALWIFYLAWTHLEKAEKAGGLSRTTTALGKPVKWLGLSIDTFVNVVIMTILFLDFPRELLVTTRLTRYLRGRNGWRRKVTLHLCSHLLDAFDIEGRHCRY